MFSPTVLSAVELFSTCAMAGVIWLVQLLVYPSFLRIPMEGRTTFHQHHLDRIPFVVIPLMLAELGSGVLITVAAWPDVHTARAIAMAFLLLIWISTFAIQVPLHHRIASDGHEAAIRQLIRTNWIRTLAWTAKAALILVEWTIRH